jgi:hypothetical protein
MVVANSNTCTASNEFKDSVKALSTLELEDLYRGCRFASPNPIKITLAITSLALSALLVLAGNAALGVGFFIVGFVLGIYSYRLIHVNDLKEKVIEDLFRERGKQIIFQRHLGGLGGFSSRIVDINRT